MYYPGISFEFLCCVENWKIKQYNSLVPNGYNLMEESGGFRKHSQESIKKMSESSRRENLSLETRRKMSESNRRENMSPKRRKRLSESKKRENLSIETRRKLSEAGKNRAISPKTRQKLSDSLKNKKKTKIHRENLSVAKRQHAHKEWQLKTNNNISMEKFEKEVVRFWKLGKSKAYIEKKMKCTWQRVTNILYGHQLK